MIKAKSPYLSRFTHPYRKAYEMYTVFWFLGLCVIYGLAIAFDMVDKALVIPFLIAFGILATVRFFEGSYIIYARSKLSGRKMTSEPLSEMKKKFSDDNVFLGYGFRWEPVHTQRVHDLSKDETKAWKLSDRWLKFLGVHKDVLPENAIGKSYLHGVSLKEKAIKHPTKNFEGGLLIVGTTQSGKGLTLQLLINQAIARGDVVIYIDPKGSDRMEQSLRYAVQKAGRGEMLLFHPGDANQKSGIRLDPFSSIASADEVADRMNDVLGTNDVFTTFAVECVKAFSAAMLYLGEKPTCKALLSAQSAGIEPYLLRMLSKAFHEFGSSEELSRAKMTFDTKDNPSELEVLVKWYERFARRKDKDTEIDFSVVIKTWRSPKEHWEKVTASITPVLSALTGGAMDKLISPQETDAEDFRPIWTLERIIESNSVLYMRLDSMTSSVASERLGSLVLSDLKSVAGKNYNLKKTGRRICLFVDEASNVANKALINIMNKGAEGGLYTTIAVQTIADLAHTMGSNAAARMFLGNCNNIIALRCMDGETRSYIAESFGQTYIRTASQSQSSSSDMEDGSPSYDARGGHTLNEKESNLLSPHHLQYLPNGEYFGLFGGGHLYKGRIPVITREEKEKAA